MPNDFYRPVLIVLILAVILCQLPARAQSKSDAGAADRPSRARCQLKALMPEEDYSSTPDPSEIFDQAIKEFSAGHYSQAEKLFEKVISIDPANADAQFNLGAIKEWGKDYTQALLHYEAALKIKPGDSEVRQAVAAVAYKLQHLPALAAREKQAKLERELETHSQLAKEAFAQRDYSAAAIHLGYLARALPADAKVQFALGQSLRALQSYELAGYRLKLAIYLDPRNDLYRHTLVDLDREVQDARGQALEETINTALSSITPFSFTELDDAGITFNEF